MFRDMEAQFKNQSIDLIDMMQSKAVSNTPEIVEEKKTIEIHESQGQFADANKPVASPAKSAKGEYDGVGRNDLCPCGSGKKFKKCHGENA